MSRHVGRMALLVAVCLLMLGTIYNGAWAGDPPGKEKISLVNISRTTEAFATHTPQVAVSPFDPELVAVSWTLYGLPVNTNAGPAPGARTADCHVSISTNGGRTFEDTNLMPILRTYIVGSDEPTLPAPGLWYCNFSWTSIGPDRTIYAGGAMFTPWGTIAPQPKQGRALVTVSRDNGRHWRLPTYGIKLANFAPGLPLSASSPPENTPWDNAMGVAAPRSPTFYSEASGYVVASEDRAKTFDTVYRVARNIPGWTISTTGPIAAAGHRLVAPVIASATPFAATCPCLGVATSFDKGETWTAQLLAQASAFSTSATGDTARYPFAAVAPDAPWRYAVSAKTPDLTSVQVFYTEDGGYTWKSAAVGPVPNPPIARVGKIGLGYTTDGRVVVVWRGFHPPDNPSVAGGPGPFDTYAALLHGNSFGPTIRVSPESSKYPLPTTEGPGPAPAASFNLNNGAGDYSTSITGTDESALVAFPYAPLPGALVLDTYFAKIPLRIMTPGCHDRECDRDHGWDHGWDHDRK